MLLIKKFGNLLLTNKKARLESIRREQLRLQRQFQFDQVHFFSKILEIPESFLLPPITYFLSVAER